MVDLDKLDNVIDDLEISSKNIMRIPNIIKSVEHITELTNQGIQALADMKDDNAHINQLCEHSSNALNDYCTKAALQNATFISKVNTMLLEIKNENNALYKEFYSEIATKFERLKSDIVVENRNIINEIQRATDEKVGISTSIIKNTCDNNLLKTETYINHTNKKINILTILCAGSLLVSLTLLVVLIIK